MVQVVHRSTVKLIQEKSLEIKRFFGYLSIVVVKKFYNGINIQIITITDLV